MKQISFILSGLISLILILVLNGNLTIPNNPLPPLAKFLHPVEGIWANGVDTSNLIQFSDISLPIDGKAIIKYDERMVPHIYADSLSDLLFLQGYIIASQRLFQLDIITRAAAGRLSEVFGARTLSADINQNRKYMERAAQNAVKAWQLHPAEYKLFGNYINGINAYIEQLSYKDYPIEFKLLNYKPEKWSYYKSALVAKYMANTLSSREDDIELMNMKLLLGDELFEELFEEGEDGGYPVIPMEKTYQFDSIYGDPDKEVKLADRIIKKQYYSEKAPRGIGSNNWVVGKSKTVNGHPIFCNDPHLTLSLPSIWFEMHLMTSDINSYGVTIPGIAGILMGFNEHIAWGETNVGHDVSDKYLIKYADDKKSTYFMDGRILDLEYDIQEIKVKGEDSYFDTLKYTEWGLIINESTDSKYDIAIQWLAAEPNNKLDINTFVDFMSCKTYSEFEKVSRSLITPAQNILFASKGGDIALRVNGLLPAKHNEDGRFIKDGSISKNKWDDFIPIAQNPQILNPESDYLTSSNQRSAGSNYPYYYNGTFEHTRNKTINKYLMQDSLFSIEDMKKMQGDSYSSLAEDLLPSLLAKVKVKHKIVDILRSWNYQYKKNEQGPIYFNLLLDLLKKETFDELYMYQDSMLIKIPEDWKFVDLMTNHCDHLIFDKIYTNERENCEDIINNAFEKLIKELLPDIKDVDWVDYKPVNINHYARIPAFSRTGIKTEGWLDAINATNKTVGPSWRMVVELGDTIQAYGVYPGGQSGNPASPFYDNAIDTWAELSHYKLKFMNRETFINYEGMVNINVN